MSQLNSIWIDLRTRLHEVLLQENHRPYAPFQDCRFPYTQDPQMTMFIGDKLKTILMDSLFSIGSKNNHNKIHLRLIPGTMETQSPIFIADCELHNITNFKRTMVGPVPGVIDQRSIRWLRNVPQRFDPSSLANLIYTKLISPFCTVICLFADDLGGTRATAKILASWLLSLGSQSSDLPMSTYPRVLILKRWDDPNATFDEKLSTICFMRELRQELDLGNGSFRQRENGQLTDAEFERLIKQQFGDMMVLALPLRPDLLHEKSVKSQLGRLRARLLQESQDMQNYRRAAKVAFSANHLKAFLHSACDHFATDILMPFSFVEASRIPNPVPRDLSSHLINFLKNTSRKTLLSFAVPVIASALSLDSYPPDMHNFEPAQVFHKLYDKVFKDIQINQYPHDLELFGQIQENIKKIFCEQVSTSIDKSTDMATAHKVVLSQFPQWKSTYSNTTCLLCIARGPDNTLSCRHCICDPCVIIHGRTTSEEPWNFILDTCPLCGISNRINFILKPYTAGTRCLSIDGGSPNDIMSLKELEDELGLPLPIREHFDIGTGSGLGALIILQIFCKEWSIDDCLNYFQIIKGSRFSQDTMSVNGGQNKYHLLSRLPSRWRETLPSGNQHGSFTGNSDLKGIFGKDKTLFECSGNGTKVAVTITNPKDSSTCIFSNYNGSEMKSRNHTLIRSEKPKDEMLIWHIGRATASDISSFKLFRGYRGLIDLTLWEQDTVWSRARKSPDIFICFGTSIEGDESSVKKYSHQWLSDHRLQCNIKDTISHSLDGLLSSLFYIELIGTPLMNTVGFFCRSQIRCRLMPSQPAFIVLVERLRNVRARFYYGDKSVPCVNSQLYEEARRGIAFSRYIEFSVTSLSDEINIEIDGITEVDQSISNCPYKLQTLIEDQGLDCVFGHKDHKRRYLGV